MLVTPPSRAELMQSFRRCLAYRQAAAWRKPWISPVRFLRNQFRKRGWSREAAGTCRTVETFHLREFTVLSGEGLSEQLGSYGIYEPELTEAFLRLISPEAVVVDIGMHLGYYTTLFAVLVGERGEVHAFEPTPSTREVAARNISRFRHVQVHAEAMWSSVTRLEFRDYGLEHMAFNSFTNAKSGDKEILPVQTFEVETTTLDCFREQLAKKIDFLKIDAESAEESILSGGERLLHEDRPVLSLEVGDREGSQDSKRVVDWMTGCGYQAWEFADGEFRPHAGQDQYGYGNLIFAPMGHPSLRCGS